LRKSLPRHSGARLLSWREPGMTRERAAAQWHDGQDCASHRPQISGLRSPVPFRQEGRIAIVTNAGRDVVDARASARQGVAGRVLKGPVSGSRRRATTNDVSSVRQNRVVLTPVAGAKSAVTIQTRPGLKCRLHPPTTVTRRIRRRGERGISRKTITQGMPGASAEPVCSCAHPLSPLRTRPPVQRAPGIPCAL
jgi:hypothetical protein